MNDLSQNTSTLAFLATMSRSDLCVVRDLLDGDLVATIPVGMSGFPPVDLDEPTGHSTLLDVEELRSG